MNWREELRAMWTGGSPPIEDLRERSDAGPSNVERLIARAIEARVTNYTLADALTLPSLRRAVMLLCSQAAALAPVAYRVWSGDGDEPADLGTPVRPQPRVVARPSSIGRPYEFTYQTVYSMIAAGDAYWRVTDRDFDRNPSELAVLNPEEVGVRWNETRTRPLYRWRDEDLKADTRAGRVEIVHIPLNRPPGELNGRSPIRDSLARLAAIAAAEEFAAAYFTSGGVPEVVLKSGVRLDKNEAADLLAQYLGEGGPRPVRVVSGDVGLEFPASDPARAQLNETRAQAATEIARLLGIPGPLLLIQTSGATITYANAQAALNELHRETLYPTYLAPIEQAWTDLVPSTQGVRFDYRELQIADLASRVAAETAYIAAGVLTPEQVAAFEGFGTDPVSSPLGRQTPPPRLVPVREAS